MVSRIFLAFAILIQFMLSGSFAQGFIPSNNQIQNTNGAIQFYNSTQSSSVASKAAVYADYCWPSSGDVGPCINSAISLLPSTGGTVYLPAYGSQTLSTQIKIGNGSLPITITSGTYTISGGILTVALSSGVPNAIPVGANVVISGGNTGTSCTGTACASLTGNTYTLSSALSAGSTSMSINVGSVTGNVTAGTIATFSTINNVALIFPGIAGSNSSFGGQFSDTSALTLNWTGSGAAINVLGPIQGVEIDNANIICSVASGNTGISLENVQRSRIDTYKIKNCQYGIASIPSPNAGSTTYNSDSDNVSDWAINGSVILPALTSSTTFSPIAVDLAGPGINGCPNSGTTGATVGCTNFFHVFGLDVLYTTPTATSVGTGNSIAVRFGGDSNQLFDLHAFSQGTANPSNQGLVFDYSLNPSYPSATQMWGIELNGNLTIPTSSNVWVNTGTPSTATGFAPYPNPIYSISAANGTQCPSNVANLVCASQSEIPVVPWSTVTGTTNESSPIVIYTQPSVYPAVSQGFRLSYYFAIYNGGTGTVNASFSSTQSETGNAQTISVPPGVSNSSSSLSTLNCSVGGWTSGDFVMETPPNPSGGTSNITYQIQTGGGTALTGGCTYVLHYKLVYLGANQF